mgnify:CR=1 FL=1
MKKFLVGMLVIITIIIAVFFQINILNKITLFGAKANIGIVLIVGIGLMCDKKTGGTVGSIYGLIMDIISRKIAR